MINATNMLGKDKSALETINVQVAWGALGLTGPGRRPRPPTRLHLADLPIGVAFRSATGEAECTHQGVVRLQHAAAV